MSEYIQFEGFLFVEITKNAHGFIVSHYDDCVELTYLSDKVDLTKTPPDFISITIPPGYWEIVAVSDEVNEEKAKRFMPVVETMLGELYKDFTEEYTGSRQTMQAYHFLLSAAGVTYDRFLILKQSKQ